MNGNEVVVQEVDDRARGDGDNDCVRARVDRPLDALGEFAFLPRLEKLCGKVVEASRCAAFLAPAIVAHPIGRRRVAALRSIPEHEIV